MIEYTNKFFFKSISLNPYQGKILQGNKQNKTIMIKTGHIPIQKIPVQKLLLRLQTEPRLWDNIIPENNKIDSSVVDVLMIGEEKKLNPNHEYINQKQNTRKIRIRISQQPKKTLSEQGVYFICD